MQIKPILDVGTLRRRNADQLSARGESHAWFHCNARAVVIRFDGYFQTTDCAVTDGLAGQPLRQIRDVGKFLLEIVSAQYHTEAVFNMLVWIERGSCRGCRLVVKFAHWFSFSIWSFFYFSFCAV